MKNARPIPVPERSQRQAKDDPEERREQRRGRQRQALTAVAVHEAILREGTEELKRSSTALAFSGLTAGLSMGVSLVAEGLLKANLPVTSWTPLVAKLGYVVGFFIVVLGRQQLFTETTLTAMLPLFHQRDRQTAYHVGRLWVVVLISNLAGAIIFAWAIAATPAFSGEAHAAFLELGRAAAQWGFGTALVKGIFAGWLIALMVWLLPAAETAKALVIILLTYIVGLAELTHIIAGSVEVAFAAISGAVTWWHLLVGYMLPTLIGNTLGGVLLVAALNHAQARGGKHADGEPGHESSRDRERSA
jgi:formate/nitrite transporter FocA (FNT family)